MSTPPSLALPPHARVRRVATRLGELAAHDATPTGPVRGTALLVPGFTGSKEDFLAVLGPLAQAGWRVVTLDLPGQYESPWGAESAYALPRLAAAVLEVAAALDAGPVHLLGHSFGGLVARAAVVAAAGGDGSASVASLTLLCSGPAAVPEPGAGRLRLLLDALGRIDVPTIWAVMRQLDAENGVPHPPADVEAFLQRRFLANDPAGLRAFAQALLVEPDRVPELAEVTSRAGVPVLVAHGVADDAWTPEEQKEMAARLDARYEVVAGAAHSPAAEAPAATAALLADFWASA